MNKFTPGPWGVYVNTSRECYDIFKPTDGIKTPNKVVAFVPYPSTGNNEEQNKNARLIAAAPELANAVQKFLEFFDKMPKGQLGKIACDIGLLNEAFISAEAAMKQAEIKP